MILKTVSDRWTIVGLRTKIAGAGLPVKWVKRGKACANSQQAVADFYSLIEIFDVDLDIALSFGELRARMMNAGTLLECGAPNMQWQTSSRDWDFKVD